MIRTVIVEDEMASQELLSAIVNEYCPYLQLVGMADTIEKGEKLIKETQPDLIFLDIHIGNQTGFELLDRIEYKNFQIIITTAHDKYELKAFGFEAMDYILKPYSPRDVIKSVQRIVEKFEENKAFLKLEKVINDSFLPKKIGKISIQTFEGLKVLKLDNIYRIEGSGLYCRIFYLEAQPLLISKSLKELEAILPSDQFFRVHDSHIINLQFVNELKNEDGCVVILENENQVPVSIERKQELTDILMGYGKK
jgi:two-component system, LytTR family, response regulator